MTFIRTGDGEVRELRAPMWLVQLLTRPPKKGNPKLGPEDIITITLADKLRILSIEGRLRGCWTHIPHEIGGVGKHAALRLFIAKMLGLIPGSTDFVFTWDGGGGWIEIKTETGTLTLTQRLFRDWAAKEGVNWAVCRTSEAALEKLREWGALDAAR